MSRCPVLCLLTAALLTSACSTSPPRDVNNLCEIFREKDDWYDHAVDASENWGSSIPVMMAIMHQESRFRADARPPRRQLLGFIPWSRASSAYGYPQAKDGTWKDYKREAGSFGADRDDFSDAIDFIGWYNYKSGQRSGIAVHDTYGLYLAYHEGHGGYNRLTHRDKPWLLDVARKVQNRAGQYRAQLVVCEDELKDGGGFFGWF
ncbi:MAG: hypothetical protein HRT77_10245 [Halioglobus sp.]|nr:hypothetical protein [Halioglobus sp.]